jgi:hypothetical protein
MLIKSGGTMEDKYVATQVILPLLLTLEHIHSNKIIHRCARLPPAAARPRGARTR